jgi:hypothetical protein
MWRLKIVCTMQRHFEDEIKVDQSVYIISEKVDGEKCH